MQVYIDAAEVRSPDYGKSCPVESDMAETIRSGTGASSSRITPVFQRRRKQQKTKIPGQDPRDADGISV